MARKACSDEGFENSFGNKRVCYLDGRGRFEFGYEDPLLFPNSHQVEGAAVSLSQLEIDQSIRRVVEGIHYDGSHVEVFHS